MKKKLFDARAKRERPFLDTKVITAWNGQMIAGYARAGQMFKNPDYLKAATRAADFILTKMRDKDGRLYRLYAAVPGEKPAARGTAFLDDYSYLIHGLLNLHDATGEKKWLDAARQLTDLAIKWHGDGTAAGISSRRATARNSSLAPRTATTECSPPATRRWPRNLHRLSVATGRDEYRVRARETSEAVRTHLADEPRQHPDYVPCASTSTWARGNATANPVGPSKTPSNPKESADVVKAEIDRGQGGGWEAQGRRHAHDRR